MKLKTLLEFDLDRKEDGKFFAYGHVHIPATYRTRDVETSRKRPAEIFADTKGEGLTLFHGVTQISGKVSRVLENGVYYHKDEIVVVHDIKLQAEATLLTAFETIIPQAKPEHIGIRDEFIKRFLMERHQWKHIPA